MSNIDTMSVNAIRVLAADAVQKAKSGHPGLPLGCAAVAYELWAKHMKHNPANPDWADRDRFILSGGHGSTLLYSLLHLFGYGLTKEDLASFRQLDSLTPGHPEYRHTKGVEATTGPLGAGMAMAVGMAIAEAHLGAKFNKEGYPVVDHYTFVLGGDGCMMEGISSEAFSLAGTLGLNKLIVIYDSNRISIEGSTDIAFTENVQKRMEAFGFGLFLVEDGNNLEEIGAADLAPSTKTYMKDMGDFSKNNRLGRNLHFGVREIAMAAIGNGITLHGMRAYVSTFFVFSDYVKPMARLSALMRIPTTYVLTHDSIGVGEDGPTHEPIEQLAMLRAMPNFHVFRPADATETIAAWYSAVTSKETPTALVLTRQNLPQLAGSSREALKGAYILADSDKETPDAIIIATGSEVSLAVDAKAELAKEGVDVRVVSMPCMDIFEEQPNEYKEKILPKNVRARVAVEALIDYGWGKYVGLDGKCVCMTGFGASAPAAALFKKYGFTTENVVAAVKSVL